MPPTRYGGTECVVSLLTGELVRRGHDVTVFASGVSVTPARPGPTVEASLWRQGEVRAVLPSWILTLGEAYRRARDGEFDVVHSHLDYRAFACSALTSTPTVTTLCRGSGARFLRPGEEMWLRARFAGTSEVERRAPTTLGVRGKALTREELPDQQQTAEEYGGPSPEDEAVLKEQGYPKLGRKLQSRVTQVEHGPYVGGTQQGDADTEQRVAEAKTAG